MNKQTEQERIADAGKTMSEVDNAIYWLYLFKNGETLEFLTLTGEYRKINSCEALLNILYTKTAIRVKPKKLRALTKDEWYERTDAKHHVKHKHSERIFEIHSISKGIDNNDCMVLVVLHSTTQRDALYSSELLIGYDFCDSYGNVLSPCGVEE